MKAPTTSFLLARYLCHRVADLVGALRSFGLLSPKTRCPLRIAELLWRVTWVLVELGLRMLMARCLIVVCSCDMARCIGWFD
jgi:hypothetical protein